MRIFIAPALALVLAVAALGIPAEAASAGCTVVAGGGRNSSFNDPQTNDRWNRLNFAFFDAAAEAVRANDTVEQAFFPVGSTDATKSNDALLAQAAKAGCTRLAFFSAYSDASKLRPELVFSLRVSPIRREGSTSAQGANYKVGAVEYEKEYRFAATPASFVKVVPSRIADQAVRDYRESRKH